MKYIHKKLANGMNVFLMPSTEAESVTYTVYIKVGSRYEEFKQAGVAHFLEHVFFKGSKLYTSAAALTAAADSIGAEWNAGTSKESTEYYIRGSKKHFDFMFTLLTDMLQTPFFDAAEIEKEKGAIVEEIRMHRDNLPRRSEEGLENAMWPDSRLGSEIAGSEQSVKGMTRKDIVAFREKWYVPGNMIIGVAGNFDQKKVFAKIKAAWGRLPKRSVPKIPAPGRYRKAEVLARRGPTIAIEKRPSEQMNISIGFPTAGKAEKERSRILSVLSVILGGGMSSRLFLNVRESKGLAYSIYSSNDNYSDAGMFFVSAGVRTADVSAAIMAINEELRRIAEVPVPRAELQKAKEQIKGHTALRLEDSQSRLDFIIGGFASRGEVKLPEQVMKEIDAVTARHVQAMARKLFTSRSLVLSAVGSAADKATLRAALQSLDKKAK